jgi:hypothetical protein
MRKLMMLFATFPVMLVSFAQDDDQPKAMRNSFFAEGGGPGIAFSANIDRRFTNSHLGFGARIGLGFVSAYQSEYDSVGYYYGNYDYKSTYTVPFQINYIFGKGSSPHTFEIGAGVTYVGKKLDIMNFYEDKQTQLFTTFSFMYRRQPKNGGFTWRLGFTPLLAKGYIQPFGAAGVGYNF